MCEMVPCCSTEISSSESWSYDGFSKSHFLFAVGVDGVLGDDGVNSGLCQLVLRVPLDSQEDEEEGVVDGEYCPRRRGANGSRRGGVPHSYAHGADSRTALTGAHGHILETQ